MDQLYSVLATEEPTNELKRRYDIAVKELEFSGYKKRELVKFKNGKKSYFVHYLYQLYNFTCNPEIYKADPDCNSDPILRRISQLINTCYRLANDVNERNTRINELEQENARLSAALDTAQANSHNIVNIVTNLQKELGDLNEEYLKIAR